MIKLLVTSDWHLDRITDGKRRFEDILEAVYQTVRIAVEKDVDYYMMLGDLGNPESLGTYRALAAAISLHVRIPNTPLIFLTGNHDIIEDGTGDNVMLPLRSASDRFTVFDKPAVRYSYDLTIIALPYTPSSHKYDVVKFIKDTQIGIENRQFMAPTVVISHLNIEGVIPGSETTDMPRGRDVFLPLDMINECIPGAIIFNGHYHKQQKYKNVHIPGSLARLSFGEADNVPGFLYMEI